VAEYSGDRKGKSLFSDSKASFLKQYFTKKLQGLLGGFFFYLSAGAL
jgi:hypothetical protein